jgi:methylmalonyl-CoA/ethylmalonyl-CoA epimerase
VTPEPLFTETLQVALVVRDLETAMRTYVNEYGIGPWDIYEFNPDTVENMTLNEEPAEYAMRLALTMVGNVQWELIQPLDDRSIYAQFLASGREGLHHLGMATRGSYQQSLEAARAKGHRVIQGGRYNGVDFAYLSTEDDLGVITEIFDWPEGHTQQPDAVYPPPGGDA